jgi:hypothetical protein
MSNTVLEAVEKAIADQTPDGGENGDQGKEEKIVQKATEPIEQDDEDTPDEDEVHAKELKEARIKQGLDILDILEDPTRNKQFYKMLGTQFEEKIEGASKKETKEAAKELVEELTELVGEEHSDLLRPIMAVVQKLLGESEKKFFNTLQDIEVKRAKADLENRYQSFIEKNEVSDEEQQLMQKLVEELPPSKDVPFEKYLKNLRRLAKSEIMEKQEKVSRREKIEANKNKTRFQNAGTNSEGKGKDAPIIKTPLDAVMAAVAELQGKQD